MENEWPPLEECEQYRCGMLGRYLQKFHWEEEDDDGDVEIEYGPDDDDDEEGTVCVYNRRSLKEFLKQVRTTRTGKVYKHLNTSKFVGSPNRLFLLTFTAKIAESGEQTVDSGEQAADVGVQTFLATVFAPFESAPVEEYEVCECFLKPEGPAPWKYIDFRAAYV